MTIASKWGEELVRAYGSTAADQILARLDLNQASNLQKMRVRINS